MKDFGVDFERSNDEQLANSSRGCQMDKEEYDFLSRPLDRGNSASFNYCSVPVVDGDSRPVSFARSLLGILLAWRPSANKVRLILTYLNVDSSGASVLLL